MNYRQLQSAGLLSQTPNISQVAAQLKISQPALSKQLLALEQELGVKLFDRSTVPMTLTAAGESFVRDARELLFREEQIKRSMEEFRTGEKARLEIGVSPFRCHYLMPDIVAQLRREFPGLQVVLHETNSAQLHKAAVEGQWDFVVMNLPVDETMVDVRRLRPEKLVLAVGEDWRSLVPTARAEADEAHPEVDLADCGELPFIVLGKDQELRQLFDKLCLTSGLRPQIVAEVVGITTAWAMAQGNVGVTVLPLHFLQGSHLGDRLDFYPIRHESSVRQPAILTRKGQYISPYARRAMELLENL